MRKPNKREMILIGVLVSAIGYTMSLDSTIAKKRRLNEQFKTAASTGELPQDVQRQLKNRVTIRRRAQASGIIDQWSQDPFVRAFTRLEIDGDGDGEITPIPPLKLQGVVVTDRGASALLNQNIYSEGDTLRGHVIESITAREVVLKNLKEGSRRRLKVE